MDIKFFGFEALSLVDFDGYLACTLFTGGCNYRCPFCHNSPLINIQATLEFEEKPIDAEITADDDILSNVFGVAEQGVKNSVNTEFTTEELQEMAENKGMLKTPLHKRAWEALTLE